MLLHQLHLVHTFQKKYIFFVVIFIDLSDMNFVKDLHIMHTADPPARFYMRDQRAAKYRPQCSILQDIMLIQFIFDSKHLKFSITTSEVQGERENSFIC